MVSKKPHHPATKTQKNRHQTLKSRKSKKEEHRRHDDMTNKNEQRTQGKGKPGHIEQPKGGALCVRGTTVKWSTTHVKNGEESGHVLRPKS